MGDSPLVRLLLAVPFVLAGVVMALNGRWGVDVANRHRLPGTKPATDADRHWFTIAGVLFAVGAVVVILLA